MTLEHDQLAALARHEIKQRDAEIERLRAALSWIEDQEPQIVAWARKKFDLEQ